MSIREQLREIDALPPPDPDDEVRRLHVALDAIEPGLSEYYVMLEAENTELREQNALLEGSLRSSNRTCAALEAEVLALREFVAASDKHEAFRETVATDGYELWIAEWEHLKREAKAARNRLAAEHGLPLPGAGEPS